LLPAICYELRLELPHAAALLDQGPTLLFEGALLLLLSNEVQGTLRLSMKVVFRLLLFRFTTLVLESNFGCSRIEAARFRGLVSK